MKKDKLKKYSIRFGITFLIVIAFLTYFSGTIDNMLLPQVKVSEVAYGTINGEQSQDDRYLIPISAVIAMGDTGSVFVTRTVCQPIQGDEGLPRLVGHRPAHVDFIAPTQRSGTAKTELHLTGHFLPADDRMHGQ